MLLDVPVILQDGSTAYVSNNIYVICGLAGLLFGLYIWAWFRLL